MTVLFHSASSVQLGMGPEGCPHAWALRYIAKIKPARGAFLDLGVKVHEVAEAFYGGGEPEWNTDAGRVFEGALHLLPLPHEVNDVAVEARIGTHEAERWGVRGAPLPRKIFDWTHALEVEGVRWVGARDLLATPTLEACARLGLEAGEWLHDWKTSKDARRYALTQDALGLDLQRALYGLDVMLALGDDVSFGRWVYFDKLAPKFSMAVPSIISADQALSVLHPWCERAKELDTIRDVKDAEKNVRACGAYGGCKHHVDHGGTCDAKRSLGSLIQARIKPKRQEHPMSNAPNAADLRAQIAARQAAREAAKAETAAAAPAVDAEAATETAVAKEAPAKPAGARVPRANKPRAAQPAIAPAPVEAAPKADPLSAAREILAVQAEVEALAAAIEELRGVELEQVAALRATQGALESDEAALSIALERVRGAL